MAKLPQWFKGAITLIIMGLSLGVIVGLQQMQLRQIQQQSETSLATLREQETSQRIRLNALEKLPFFGFNNLASDWVFLNFLEYFGDNEVRRQVGFSLAPEYFEVILGRDPRFLEAYNFLSVSTSIYAGRPELSVALMERGLQSLTPQNPPKSYHVWRTKGIDELLFLGQGKAAQKSFEMAANWANQYSDTESKSVAMVSQRTAQFLARNPDSKIAQVSAWSMVVSRAADAQTRQFAIHKIESLGGKVTILPTGAVQVFLPKQD